MKHQGLESGLFELDTTPAQEWVAAHSVKGETFVNSSLEQRFLGILNSQDRIRYPRPRGEWIYNYYYDCEHPRGQWRRCTKDSYLSGDAAWVVLVDVDKLAEKEQRNWVWKGAHVRAYADDRALVHLSDGGEDAVEIREYDLTTGEFVAEDAFTLSRARTQVSWVDKDTLLVATKFDEQSLTHAGYPYHVRLWKRGQALEQAAEFFSGHEQDILVSGWADTTPGYERKFVRRYLDFQRSHTFVETDSGLQILELPEDCEIEVHKQWLFIMPREQYLHVAGGSLGVIDLEEFLDGSRNFRILFEPTPTCCLHSLHFSAKRVILTLLDQVATRIQALNLEDFSGADLPLPPLVTAHVVATNEESDELWIDAHSFLWPSTLYYQADGNAALVDFAHAPEHFDATGMETRQHFAVSADGTKIPYFISGRFEGQRPCLVTAYGGFESSRLPSYAALRGSWLEAGHYLVLANLRGGGEFGPQWHEQVVREQRYKIYQDHQAVLKDLAQRGYCHPEQIIVRGGSNGGLLCSVALTSYPELLGAAIIQVPLTDMLRYNTWSAGHAWVAEYGDPNIPAERAALEQYSPLHHVALHPDADISVDDELIEPGITASGVKAYPPALVTTSAKDDRVHPAHARLFALALERAGQPVTFVETADGGHAGAADAHAVAHQEALIHGWLAQFFPGE